VELETSAAYFAVAAVVAAVATVQTFQAKIQAAEDLRKPFLQDLLELCTL
jgi:hypothetical protein